MENTTTTEANLPISMVKDWYKGKNAIYIGKWMAYHTVTIRKNPDRQGGKDYHIAHIQEAIAECRNKSTLFREIVRRVYAEQSEKWSLLVL